MMRLLSLADCLILRPPHAPSAGDRRHGSQSFASRPVRYQSEQAGLEKFDPFALLDGARELK